MYFCNNRIPDKRIHNNYTIRHCFGRCLKWLNFLWLFFLIIGFPFLFPVFTDFLTFLILKGLLFRFYTD